MPFRREQAHPLRQVVHGMAFLVAVAKTPISENELEHMDLHNGHSSVTAHAQQVSDLPE
jgi:hypothetical protein